MRSSFFKILFNIRFFAVLFLLLGGLWAHAAYIPFDTNVTGNIGVGTSTPQSKFVIVNGNVGIGTWTAAGGNLIINGNGNVGIGSAWPGQLMDVQGTLRVTNFTMSGQVPMNGYFSVSYTHLPCWSLMVR